MEISKVNNLNRDTTTIKSQVLRNQEKRAEELNSLENFFNKLIQILEKEWKSEHKTHNWDYTDYCKKYIAVIGILNKDLRSFQDKNNSIYNKIIDSLLSLEENNYKYTLGILVRKIKHYDLLKRNADDEEFDKNDLDIAEFQNKQREVREKINELIQELVYL